MGLRCSLLGHDFGEPEVEREREERGNEVIETVREVKICERCGSESVVSENTEVRSIQPEPTEPEHVESGGSESADVESAVRRVSGESAESASVGNEFEDVTAEEDDGLILEDETEERESPEREPGQWPDADDTRQDEREGATVGSGVGGDADVAQDAATETDVAGDSEAEAAGDEGDVEFIDADAEAATDADAGADADAEDVEGANGASASEHQPWPDANGEDEGFDAKPSSGGGVELSGDLSADEDDEDVEYVEAGFESAGTLDPERTGSPDGNALICPQCGNETPANGSSLRAGDICPECRKGYLTEQ